jgi:phthiocerol/phenolphthiocerol synthesis type-I polyketide synthase E
VNGVNEGAIAIVALAARVPGAPDAETFWRNTLEGQVSIERHGREAMLADGVAPEELDRPGYVPAKGVVAGATRFDAHLFGFSPAEAAAIDPQQRIFLECCREALDRAAIDARRFRGQTGVYAGQFLSTYLLNNLARRADVVERLGVATIFQGNTVDQLATRVAYKLDLRGPAVTVQSACSTSLVAVHLACRALASYECDLALAGGVTLTFPQRAGYVHTGGGIVSPDGACRPFDAAANGTVFSDGAGVVVLRRLRDALADGDPIRAVIRGSALTNDGARKVAYSAPSAEGQARAIAEAMEFAEVAPGSIGFVETHGTGTPVGDPIEIQALREAFGAGGTSRVALGSAKANIGHLDAAAGVVGLIKAAFAVERGVVPPLASFSAPNPALPLAGTPFYLPVRAEPWPRTDGPRRASVSAFGVGGTNAHVVLEEAPARARAAAAVTPRLVPLSAKTRSALVTTCERVAAAVEAAPAIDAGALQATLALGRPEMEWRTTALVTEVPDAAVAIRRAAAGAHHATAREAVFLFPGQGALGSGIDRALYRANRVFRDTLDEAAAYLRDRHALDVATPLFGGDRELLHDTRIAQPASFALSYALARALQRDGVEPAAMIGHSVGEYVAAALAGVLGPEDALDVLVARGALMGAQPAGVMLAVGLSAADALARLEPGIELAADNAPHAVVVAGPPGDVARFEQRLSGAGIAARRLETSRAFHTAAMDPVLGAFGEVLANVRLRPAQRSVVSTLTGRTAAPAELADPAHWVRHAREPVRFREAVKAAASSGRVFVEAGCGTVLTQLVRRTAGETVPAVALLDPRRRDSHAAYLHGLGRLWSAGIALRWDAHTEPGATRIELPPYPFESEEHFYEAGGRSVESRPAGREERVERWLGVPAFVPAPGRSAPRLGERRRRWLLYVPRPDAFEELVERLEAHGQLVTRVAPGAALRRLARGVYEMRLDDAEQTIALMHELRGLVRTPNVILHLLAAGDAPVARDEILGPFLTLARSFAAESAATEVRLGLVTRGVFDVLGTETLSPDAATAIGPALVLPQELGTFAVRHVDLADGAGARRAGDLERALERVLGDEGEALALRNGRAYRLDVVPIGVDGGAPAIRDGGVYAIAGGLGGLGSALAERLVREHGATVVAIGRRALPPRERWDAVDGDPPLAAAVRRIREIEAGARGRIVTATADVRDSARLGEVLRETRARLGALHGVVHAAGGPGGGALVHDTLEAAHEALSVKAGGAEALARALEETGLERELDFVALCSSTAALVGGAGQWSYAAANAYLDAYAAQRARRDGPRWISIGWDTLDVGIALRDAAESSALRELRGELALDGARAGEAFELALRTGEPRVVVSRLVAGGLAEARALFARVAADRSHEKHARPELEVPFTPPRSELEERLAEIWSDVLAVDRVGIDDSFADLGGHSLLAAQLVAHMRQAFDVDVTLAMLFEHETIAALAAEIERRIVAELEAVSSS